MSSVLHPTGPEEPRVYWIRRALVVGILILLVALLVWALSPKGGDQAGEASSAVPTADQQTPSTAPSPTASTPTGASASPTSSGSGSASDTASTSTSGSPSPTSSTATAAQICDAKDLRVTITGPKTAKIGKHIYWDLSVINGSSSPCTVKVDGDNFEVRVFSGTDRIFSTNDCADWQKKFSKSVGSQKAHEWRLRWNVDRSAAKCKSTNNIRPGTYVATADLDGAEPAQFVMQVTS